MTNEEKREEENRVPESANQAEGNQAEGNQAEGNQAEGRESRDEITSICEESVREQLKQVIDPELFVNIVDLGLVYVVDVEPAPEDDSQYHVKVEMTMTSPMCPAGPQLVGNSRQVIEAMPGVASAEIKVVMDPPWTSDMMTEDARDQLNIF